MMISLLYESIAACNTQGVKLLQEDKLDQALASFQGGLATLLQGLGPQGDNTPVVKKQSFAVTDYAAPQTVVHSSFTGIKEAQRNIPVVSSAGVSFMESKTRRARSTETNVDAFIFFSRALLFPAKPKDCSLAEKQECYGKLMSAVLTYNVGLTRHLEGLRAGSSALLNEALDFYSLAYTSMASSSLISEAGTTVRDSGLALLGLLAILNNTGHIHMYFRCFDTANLYISEVSYQLAKHKLVATTLLAAADCGLFFLNAFFYQEFPPRTAPAA